MSFDKPFVLISEGRSDTRFFKRLFEVRGIGDDFSIWAPERDLNGNTDFGRHLSSISLNESFIKNVRATLIVSDNDDDPSASFNAVRDQIRLSGQFAVPSMERELAKEKGKYTTMVLMLPPGKIGNLESLCLEAAYYKWSNIKVPLDKFVDSCPVKEWPVGKQSKMRMQTILAAINKKQPDAGFASSWSQKDAYQIPLDHESFDELAEFIRDFHRNL